MSNPTRNRRMKKEFLDNRMSYRWFSERFNNNFTILETDKHLLQIEILKELQFMNDLKIDDRKKT